jgi:lauroyl/myristoyl acyltransferase
MAMIVHRLVVAPLLGLLGTLSAATADRLGGMLGVAAFHLRVRRRVANETMTRCLGITGAARAVLVRRSYATMGADFIALWTTGGHDGWERHVVEANPLSMRSTLARNRAALFITPHLGVWEIGAHVVGRITGGVVAYAKPQHNPPVDALVNAKRAALGIDMVMAASGDRTAALRAMRAARNGTPVGLMGDQRPGRHEGAPARFFGHPAWCHQGPAFFVTKVRMALIPGLCVRRRAGSYVNFCGLARDCAGLDESAVVQLAIDLQCAMIAAVPGQYFWQHRRFAGPPPEVPPRPSEPWRGGLRFIADRS